MALELPNIQVVLVGVIPRFIQRIVMAVLLDPMATAAMATRDPERAVAAEQTAAEMVGQNLVVRAALVVPIDQVPVAAAVVAAAFYQEQPGPVA
jgi:hypothetical protein